MTFKKDVPCFENDKPWKEEIEKEIHSQGIIISWDLFFLLIDVFDSKSEKVKKIQEMLEASYKHYQKTVL